MDLNDVLRKAVAEALTDMRREVRELVAQEREQELVLTPSQLAERLGVSTVTVSKEAKKEGFPCMRVSGSPRYYWPDVLAYYRSHKPSVITEDAINRRKLRRAHRA